MNKIIYIIRSFILFFSFVHFPLFLHTLYFYFYFFLGNALIRFVILKKKKESKKVDLILHEFYCISYVIYLEIENLKYFKRKDRRNTYMLFYKFMNYKNN